MGRVDERRVRDAVTRDRWLPLFDLGPGDARALDALHGVLETAADMLLGGFYEHILADPDLKRFFDDRPERLEALQRLHREHLLGAPHGFDVDKLATCLDQEHALAAAPRTLCPQWYLAGASLYLRLVIRLLSTTIGGAKSLPSIEAFIKAVMLDASLAVDLYVQNLLRQETTRAERSAREATDALRAHEELDRMRDDLVDLLVHDLKNPLQAIALQASVVRHGGVDALEARGAELLGIERTCADLEGVFDDVAKTVTDVQRAHGELDRANAELVNLLAHDLKRPLEGIAAHARLLRERGVEASETHDNRLVQIERGCAELRLLIDDILDVGKLESGRTEEPLQVVRVQTLVAELLEEYDPVIDDAGMRVVNAIGPELPRARANPRLLKRVLANLIMNAVRHSGSKQVRFEAEAKTAAVVIRVIDYGRGIAPEDQRQIFEKFKMGPSTGDPGVNTGRGLYFCRLATEQMGGRIRLTSEPGRTVFEIELAGD